ncbi:hypothetical protein HHK36_025993 [Tetracentron sinense]|uniref:WAT1-related protein n=1 Tax=Tetracentron sinense TaxID=13715 RepID=A0A834YJT5_TETSI|nr:hypothetical protein HHK36_025993 [Tetracentron sinense]
MVWFEDHMPVMAMLAMQLAASAAPLAIRAALLQGMNARVYIVYRQVIATLAIAPIAYFLEGFTVSQNLYIQGLYLTTSSIASAMNNLVPAITFLMAVFARVFKDGQETFALLRVLSTTRVFKDGQETFALLRALRINLELQVAMVEPGRVERRSEKVDIRSFRSVAKIIGTVVCVIGATSMALLKGPKLLNTDIRPANTILHSGIENWIMGCLLLFGSTCCSSLWFIIQVPILARYPNQLSFTAWSCFLSTVQSAIVTLFLEQDPRTWNFHSPLELWSCFYSGILGSSVSIFVNAWCISRRGPLFCAMFNPLNTVVVLIIGCLFLNEELYTGSLAGSIMVVIGLYVVLWGKAKDTKDVEGDMNTNPRIHSGGIAKVMTEPHSG